MSEEHFLLIKRGLYYRPSNQGYTGIKENAGRYREVDALGLDGVAAIHEDDAPEYSSACFADLAQAHMAKKLQASADRIEKLEAACEDANEDIGRCLERIEQLEAECSMLAAGACIYPNGNGLLGDDHGNSFCGIERERSALDLRETDLMARVNQLEAALNWYADQMCEGLCQSKDPKACASIGADNCSGCPAVVALAS